jgi:hypothetical protein
MFASPKGAICHIQHFRAPKIRQQPLQIEFCNEPISGSMVNGIPSF